MSLVATVRTVTTSRSFDDLLPRELVETALASGQQDFLAIFESAPLLLVRIAPTDIELAAGLQATVPRASDAVKATPIVEPMDFDTARSGSTFRSGDNADTGQRDEPERLARRLAGGPVFVAPLRKRAGIDVAFQERISVGRTANKDIVLRHVTVSKFHGWFELSEQGAAYFTDAGSKNGTRVNGKVISPRERVRLRPGDVIRVGSVDVDLCLPQTFWEALHTVPRG